MDPIVTALLAFTEYISVVHVLALNLIGWMSKGCMWHTEKLKRWTDVIPVELGVIGVILAFLDPVESQHHPVLQGLANAGLAWLLHQGVKQTKQQIEQFQKKAKNGRKEG